MIQYNEFMNGLKRRVGEKAIKNKNEFLEFLQKYNAIELAFGVVIGGASKDLVNSIVNDLIMPIIGALSPSGSWREIQLTLGAVSFKIGNFFGSLVNFLIVAIIAFIIVKKILKIEKES